MEREMRRVLGCLIPLAALTGLALAFFRPLVLHPTEVLYSDHSDFLVKHIPAKRFLTHEWRENGELPLWWPYTSGGAPFVHDIEVQAFYPPHLVLYLIPEESVGATLSWLVVVHVMIAGWCMYAYARSQGLRSGAIVAAIGYMFAGRWMMHLLDGGHYSLIGLAWWPLLLLFLEGALRTGSLLRATAAGVVSALLILGTQPQWTFYAGIVTVGWTFGTVLEQAGWLGTERRIPLLRGLFRWVACGAWAAAIALGLSAVQLLPTAEAASQSMRGISGVGTRELLMGGVRSLLFLIGPALTREPPQLAWEDRGGLALLWLLSAVIAALVGPPKVRYQAGVAAALLIYGLGGGYFLQKLPVFCLFRQPARALLLLSMPVAFLTGFSSEVLVCRDLGASARNRGRRLLRSLSVATLILAGGFALRLFLQNETPRWHLYWLSLAITVPATFTLFSLRNDRMRSFAGAIWALLLIIDLLALVAPLPATRREVEVFEPSVLVRSIEPTGRVLDHLGPTSNSPLGTSAPIARLGRIESLRGFDPLDNLRYKEYLQFISGEDQPLRPFDSPLAFPIMGDMEIKNKSLLDLLGVRYLLQSGERPRPSSEWTPLARDPDPVAYDCCGRDGGRQPLPPYDLYENCKVFPRAFVVYDARPLPPRHEVLAALASADLRRQVLLEGDSGVIDGPPESSSRAARITDYRPNRVTVEVDDGPAGWLVLGDIWYPGWRCTIDGADETVRRADYLFRAVPVTGGRHLVEFRYVPESYRVGRLISLATVAITFAVASASFIVRSRRRTRATRVLSVAA
jgi:hypothetical protein